MQYSITTFSTKNLLGRRWLADSRLLMKDWYSCPVGRTYNQENNKQATPPPKKNAGPWIKASGDKQFCNRIKQLVLVESMLLAKDFAHDWRDTKREKEKKWNNEDGSKLNTTINCKTFAIKHSTLCYSVLQRHLFVDGGVNRAFFICKVNSVSLPIGRSLCKSEDECKEQFGNSSASSVKARFKEVKVHWW